MTSNPEFLFGVASTAEVVARVAIAGDFLPAGNLTFAHGDSWASKTEALAPIFSTVDATFANLEAPVDVDGLRPTPLTGIGTIVFAPVNSLDYLRAIRVPAVGIANNHTFDFGEAGLTRTCSAIERANMILVGSCVTTIQQPSSYIWRGPDSIRVGFWAAARASRELATRTKAGVEPATLARGCQALADMKSRGSTFAVALLHAGCLRTNRPDPADVALMDSLAAAGFDVVAASHSHRISGHKCILRADGKKADCFYGLGSIASGYVASPEEREGLVIVAGLGADGALAKLEVHAIELAADGFGVIPDLSHHTAILERFHNLSAELRDGSYERMFYDEVGRGLGRLYLRDVGASFRQSGVAGLARKASRVRLRHVKRLFHKVVTMPTERPVVRSKTGAAHD